MFHTSQIDSSWHAAQLLDVNGETKVVLIPFVVAVSSHSPSCPSIYKHHYIYIFSFKNKHVTRTENGRWRMVLQLYILSWAFSSCLRRINKSTILFIPSALLKRLPSLVYYCLIFLFRIINCERWKFIYQLLSLESCNKLLKIRRVWNFICSSLMFFTLICSVECFVIFVNLFKYW